jgi:hypothetical protein
MRAGESFNVFPMFLVGADNHRDSRYDRAMNPSEKVPAKTPPETGPKADPKLPPDKPKEADAKKPLTPEEQMAQYEESLKETDWGHQPC